MSDSNGSHLPNPTIQYYSGSQVSVYLNDIWIDDTASYELMVRQNKQPIYGYGSQHFDFVAQGKMMVTGTLTINFVDPNYLWVIIGDKNAKTRAKERASKDRLTDEFTAIKQDSENKLKSVGRTPASDAFDNRLIKQPNPDLFENMKELYEEHYWGKPKKYPFINEEPMNHEPFDLTFIYRGDSLGLIERAEGVELIGNAKAVNSDGEPIQEVYSFIARKIR